MVGERIQRVRGRGVHVPGDDIDTDQILPARFLRCVTFDALGAYLFRDARSGARGAGKLHPLDDPRHAGASVMVSGHNFGCGSSREHAPQALHRAGFRAVLAESFGDIFFGNATMLGVPCLTMAHGDLQRLAAAIEAEPGLELEVDVEALQVRAGGSLELAGRLAPSTREALLRGAWDPLTQMLDARAEVTRTHDGLPYTRW